jgi:hypothetical protein
MALNLLSSGYLCFLLLCYRGYLLLVVCENRASILDLNMLYSFSLQHLQTLASFKIQLLCFLMVTHSDDLAMNFV